MFGGVSKGAGILILVVLAAVALFLVEGGVPDVHQRGHRRVVPVSYVGPLVFGTIWAAFLALVIATPLAMAVALFTSHYAPRRLAAPLGYFIDLLAAVPSVVYGLWGSLVLAPVLARSVYPWLEDNLGFIPLFKGPAAASGRAMMTVAVVLAVMILPIITAISREVFLQTPRLHEEASLALGATRWEMIRQAVLPYGRSGVISGAMLGLGRALGETMAVAIILSPADIITFNIISNAEPEHDRRQHRPQVPRVVGHRGQPADRHRPRAVRADVRRQRRSPGASPGPGSREPTDDRHRDPAHRRPRRRRRRSLDAGTLHRSQHVGDRRRGGRRRRADVDPEGAGPNWARWVIVTLLVYCVGDLRRVAGRRGPPPRRRPPRHRGR